MFPQELQAIVHTRRLKAEKEATRKMWLFHSAMMLVFAFLWVGPYLLWNETSGDIPKDAKTFIVGLGLCHFVYLAHLVYIIRQRRI